MKKMLFLVVGLVIGLGVGLSINYGQATKSGTNTRQIAAVTPIPPNRTELLALVNAERSKVGAAPLKEDVRLDASAQYKASDMAQRSYFGHYDPSNRSVMNGVQMGYTVTNHDTCKEISENIRENGDVNDSPSAVAGWVGSPPHYKALIDTRYTLIGFGIDEKYVVAHFCEQ